MGQSHSAAPSLFNFWRQIMFVRLLTGARSGEIAEMKFADAKPLLDDGRAVRAYQEPRSEVKKQADPEMERAKLRSPRKKVRA